MVVYVARRRTKAGDHGHDTRSQRGKSTTGEARRRRGGGNNDDDEDDDDTKRKRTMIPARAGGGRGSIESAGDSSRKKKYTDGKYRFFFSSVAATRVHMRVSPRRCRFPPPHPFCPRHGDGGKGLYQSCFVFRAIPFLLFLPLVRHHPYRLAFVTLVHPPSI